MAELDHDKSRVDRAKSALDEAVRVYKHEVDEAWDNKNGGVVVGWVLGLAISRYHGDEEENNLVIESAPGTNNFLARGLADATAESFQAQASGWGEDAD